MPNTRTVLAALGVVAVGAWMFLQPERTSFPGKVVVITGGSRGLGLVLARQLARTGARLAVLARSEIELQEARRQIEARARKSGGEVLTVVCDVSEQDEVRAAVERVVQHYGRVDVLINNAGVMQVGPFEHMRREDFEESLAVHFWGALYMTWSVLPHMRAQGGGRIVNITSVGGKVAMPHLLAYCAGKHALVGLSEGLRHELAKEGIVVTTVCPGLMRTGSPRNAQVKGQRDKEYAWFVVGDSLPVLAIDAERAAAKILTACRRGRARLTITPQAKLLSVLNELAPGAFALAADAVNRLLPEAVGAEGDANEPGRRHETGVSRSFLTVLGRNAAERNNEGTAERG